MVRLPAPVLTSTLFKSICRNGDELSPVLTLIVHTPIVVKAVTHPATGHKSPGPPSNTVMAGLIPSLTLNVATADAGAGPISTAAQLNAAAHPIAMTAFLNFISASLLVE
jgi:hypothetical protein